MIRVTIIRVPMKQAKAARGLHLSDGVAEELTTGMAELKGLRVVAATSAFQFRGKSEDVRKIGQALNAETLLEGSISRISQWLAHQCTANRHAKRLSPLVQRL